MRSPTILLLLLASFVGLSNSTIYWLTGVEQLQVQANLILFAHENHGTDLLYELTPKGNVVDHFLHTRSSPINRIVVQEAHETIRKDIVGVAQVQEEGRMVYLVKMTLTPSATSPTGYTMINFEKCFDCQPTNTF
ncbi:hypothetical protein GCK72_006794 [Caenorhabditis remanei]|uniref:Uncharacterized protein n=1 Tax=Caenorhabditis remanei TaxID=31234 RepID=A0A6A5HJH9_CAERE|nr:hypothetical protein GCK72_006794 [Caenorhabditis remanei]KAF1766836.1 hypothetical protein GCK72_006794 [Caenorhabditis remanei]